MKHFAIVKNSRSIKSWGEDWRKDNFDSLVSFNSVFTIFPTSWSFLPIIHTFNPYSTVHISLQNQKHSGQRDTALYPVDREQFNFP